MRAALPLLLTAAILPGPVLLSGCAAAAVKLLEGAGTDDLSPVLADMMVAYSSPEDGITETNVAASVAEFRASLPGGAYESTEFTAAEVRAPWGGAMADLAADPEIAAQEELPGNPVRLVNEGTGDLSTAELQEFQARMREGLANGNTRVEVPAWMFAAIDSDSLSRSERRVLLNMVVLLSMRDGEIP